MNKIKYRGKGNAPTKLVDLTRDTCLPLVVSGVIGWLVAVIRGRRVGSTMFMQWGIR